MADIIPTTPLQLIGYAVLLLLTYTILRLLYNITLHPLSAFPGPLLSRATILPSQYHLLRGQHHRWVHSLHLRYGPIVRLTPTELSFTSPQAWKDIYGHKATGQPEFSKDMQFYGPDWFSLREPGLIRSGEVAHARQRKLVAHAFSDKALREQEGLLKGYVGLLVQKLGERAGEGEEVNMVDWLNFTTFDIMADLTFGEPLKLLKEGAYTTWVKSLFGNLKMMCIVQAMRMWPVVDGLVNWLLPKSMKEKRKEHMQHSITRVEKRLERKTERPDIWTYILRHSQDEEHRGKGLSIGEMQSNAALFMFAGTETTATQLSNLTYQLLTHEKYMQRLVKEIRDAFKTYDEMTMQGLAQLEFLNAIIEEGLRIYPPVPIGPPRRVPAQGGVVAGQEIPGGTTVSIGHYAAYHSPENFKDPNDFRPERWLPEGEEEFAKDNKFALQPFSYGPRNCVGKNLAYQEMRLILSTILWNFDMKLADTSGEWTDQETYILWHKQPLMVGVTPVRRD